MAKHFFLWLQPKKKKAARSAHCNKTLLTLTATKIEESFCKETYPLWTDIFFFDYDQRRRKLLHRDLPIMAKHFLLRLRPKKKKVFARRTTHYGQTLLSFTTTEEEESYCEYPLWSNMIKHFFLRSPNKRKATASIDHERCLRVGVKVFDFRSLPMLMTTARGLDCVLTEAKSRHFFSFFCPAVSYTHLTLPTKLSV